jgi:hypothetical protein
MGLSMHRLCIAVSTLLTLVTSTLQYHNRVNLAKLFVDPPKHVRPYFRYWLPDAGIDGNVVAENIASAGKIGAGGVQLLSFFNYGGYGGSTSSCKARTEKTN